ncbi:MAG: amidohydrolase family protein [Steroidobacteraceae bacterium]
MSRTIFLNANLLDGVAPARRAAIVVENDRIASVADTPDVLPAPRRDDTVFDLAGRTLMPGLIGGHLHLTYHKLDVFDLMGSDMKYPATYIAVAAAKNAETVLKAGFTAGIGAGGTYNMDVVLKQLIADGLAVGPRLVACGKDFCATGHPVDYKPEQWLTRQDALGQVCDGPDEFRKAVRQEAKRGVEVIKLFVEGGHGLPKSGSRMSYEEIATVCETAHLSDIRVRAHVQSREMIKTCLRAGVDIIDHADQMNDEIIEEFVRRGVFVLPSLYHLKVMVGVMNTREELDEWYGYARGSLAKAVKAGVKLVIGDDFGTLQGPHGDNGKELAVYTDDIGIAPLEVIKWATANGAEMMQRKDIGKIEAGRLADLLVVDGDPLQDMKVLGDRSRLKIVMQGGQFITCDLPVAQTVTRASNA